MSVNVSQAPLMPHLLQYECNPKTAFEGGHLRSAIALTVYCTVLHLLSGCFDPCFYYYINPALCSWDTATTNLMSALEPA